MLIDFSAEGLLDIVFHVWVIYYFVLGVKTSSNLCKSFPQGVALTQEELDNIYAQEKAAAEKLFAPQNDPFAAETSAPKPVRYDPMTGEPVYESSASEVTADEKAEESAEEPQKEEEEQTPRVNLKKEE